jgi:hypothetical protein
VTRFQDMGMSLIWEETVTQPCAFVVQVLAAHVEAALLLHRQHPATHAKPDSQTLNQEIFSPTLDRPERGSFLPSPVHNTSP